MNWLRSLWINTAIRVLELSASERIQYAQWLKDRYLRDPSDAARAELMFATSYEDEARKLFSAAQILRDDSIRLEA